MNGRSLFLDVVSGNPEIVRYVQLFRMPLFLTRLDEEFKQYDDTDWENGEKADQLVYSFEIDPNLQVTMTNGYSTAVDEPIPVPTPTIT